MVEKFSFKYTFFLCYEFCKHSSISSFWGAKEERKHEKTRFMRFHTVAKYMCFPG